MWAYVELRRHARLDLTSSTDTSNKSNYFVIGRAKLPVTFLLGIIMMQFG